MGQAALHRRPCSMQSVCEAGFGPRSVESVKGKSANIPIPGHWDSSGNPATNLGTAARTPVKSSLFLLMGSLDHGSESFERRWSMHPGQQRATTLWGRFVLPTENPGQQSLVARPYQEPQQVSWAKSLWSMEQCSQGKSAKWRRNLGRSLGSKGWPGRPAKVRMCVRAGFANRSGGLQGLCTTACVLVEPPRLQTAALELSLPRGT